MHFFKVMNFGYLFPETAGDSLKIETKRKKIMSHLAKTLPHNPLTVGQVFSISFEVLLTCLFAFP